MTNYYVYYKLDAGQIDRVRLSVQELFKKVKSRTNVEGRWLRRRDDPLTYMEVYEGVTDAKAFESVLEREAASLGLARKTETFIDVPDRPGVAR